MTGSTISNRLNLAAPESHGRKRLPYTALSGIYLLLFTMQQVLGENMAGPLWVIKSFRKNVT